MVILMLILLVLSISYCPNTIYGNHISCFNEPYSFENNLPEDISWLEYTNEVYNYSSSLSSLPIKNHIVDKYKVSFYYKNTNIQVQPIDWLKEKIYPDWYSNSNKYRNGYITNRFVPSYSWVEVSRFSSEFLWHGFEEGFAAPPWYRHSDPMRAPYGCWFFYAKGTGIFVNVRKTLTIENEGENKEGAKKHFPELNQSTMCYNNDKSKKCKDKYYCTAALTRGYDSIQIGNKGEVIICSGECATKAYSGTCPPTEIRSGWNASEVCDCSEQSLMFNCGQKLRIGEMFSDTYNPQLTVTESSMNMQRFDGSRISYRPLACIATNNLSTIVASTFYKLNVIFGKGMLFTHNTSSIDISDDTSMKYILEDTYKKIKEYNLINNKNYHRDISSSTDNMILIDFEYHHIVNQEKDDLLGNNFPNIYISNLNGIAISRFAYIDFHNTSLYNIEEQFDWKSMNSFKDFYQSIKPLQNETFQSSIRTTIINITTSTNINFKIGLILYHSIPDHRDNYKDLIREIKDNAMCLRTAGISFIFMIFLQTHHELLLKEIRDHTKGYIDMILIMKQQSNNLQKERAYDDNDYCIGKWFAYSNSTNRRNTAVITSQIDASHHNKNILQVLIEKDKNGISIRNDRISIDFRI